ncbi:virulence RhuM family protein [Echinicola marina]|uniref:Death-on-curing protein n=1 Tax=Echinicola strongylocentroti TaxID=1795355 RepID=A0A2Z4IID2_9BACT|nr:MULTISPECIES: RhuM family protein [Echinicola]AWW30183.1 death-on-curing protein [Echinicola strongylocentroti]UCS93858.1 virulence RhuM family protein [Echinicola marina]
MEKQIEIYQGSDGKTEIKVKFEEDTVWLNRNQLTSLFGRDIKTIGKHINNIFNEGELEKEAVVANFATTASDGKSYQVDHYNLDVIISVGYRVKSIQGTQFRQWATSRLKDYLIKGYAINEKRLAQKQQEVQTLKNGIRILSRAIEEKIDDTNYRWLGQFAKGLELLDDYDHENLDQKGVSNVQAIYPTMSEYQEVIEMMKADFDSSIFGKEKDASFQSAVAQIAKGFGDEDFYPTLEEKASTLLYLIVKNHGFVDGNKRIAAACFLLFLEKNGLLQNEQEHLIISNEALASLTLFIASSKPEEVDVVKRLVVSVLNRSR